MTRTTILLDPTPGVNAGAGARKRVPGLPSLEGRKVGFLDIGKRQGDILLDRLEVLFGERGIAVERYAKPTFAKCAPDAVIGKIARRCDAVVEALAD